MVVCVSTASSHEGPRLFFFSGSKDFPDYPAYLASQRQMGGCVEDPCLQTHDLTEGTGQDISLVTIILTASLKPLGLNQAACSWAVRSVQGGGQASALFVYAVSHSLLTAKCGAERQGGRP